MIRNGISKMGKLYNKGSIRDWLKENGWNQTTENFFTKSFKKGSELPVKVVLSYTNAKDKYREGKTSYRWRIYPDYLCSSEYTSFDTQKDMKEYLNENGYV